MGSEEAGNSWNNQAEQSRLWNNDPFLLDSETARDFWMKRSPRAEATHSLAQTLRTNPGICDDPFVGVGVNRAGVYRLKVLIDPIQRVPPKVTRNFPIWGRACLKKEDTFDKSHSPGNPHSIRHT